MFKINIHNIKTNKNINTDILFFTDLHFSSQFQLENQMIKQVEQIKPSYICITGDIVDSTQILEEEINRLEKFIERISIKAKVLIVLENHDLENMKHHINRFNERIKKWKQLFNHLENVYILDNAYYKDKNINVLGVTLPNNYYYEKPYENEEILYQILSKIKPSFSNNTYNMLLIHSPRRVFNNKNNEYIKDIDLILCGHMHGGVVPKPFNKLPTSRGIISPYKTLFPKYARGMCRKKIENHEIKMLVSGGVTKLGPYVPKYLQKLNKLYDNELELIKVMEKKI